MKRQNGLTLIELLLTIVVLTVLLAVGVPSFKEFIKNNRLIGQTNDLVVAVQLARNEAVKRGSGSVVCASDDQATCSGSNNWSSGWIVFSDLDQEGDLEPGTGACLVTEDCIIRTRNGLEKSNIMTANAALVQYSPNGLAVNIPVDPDDASKKRFVFTLISNDCYSNQLREISISQHGHTHIAKAACP